MESGEQALQRAIATISQSDPLTQLLEQVKLGRMKPTDAGLRAVTGSWMGTYQKVIQFGGLTSQALRRIDPKSRNLLMDKDTERFVRSRMEVPIRVTEGFLKVADEATPGNAPPLE